ncbi:Rhodanese-related sulfurtransferase [Nitrosomonas sp. Nm51]|uniref:rhodanese-like domain-containing protein n=1 Tax=Nitrosomonas sp. Nm51 TaxID=133720 RepID=UPI0008C9FDC0|nr:rhodanese-like domain-containing protein [Nitrosomonas sp. Nm51]SEQ85680.1 Rhodanese-related sulfurtransferase [Nitrosomonas sp. Nm51]
MDESSIFQDYFLLRSENIFFVIAAIVSAVLLIWPAITKRGTKEIDTRKAIELINYEDAVVLDVRDDSEFVTGHLPNSKHIPTEKIEDRWVELSKFKEKPIVVIYKSGIRSGHASNVLFKNGFKKVHNLMGGIDAWKRASLPVVKR